MKKLVATLLSVALLLLSVTGCNNAQQTDAVPDGDSPFEKINIKLSYSGTDLGMDGLVAAKFAELVAEATDNRVTVDCYGNAQLASGSMQRLLELLIQGGAFEIAILSDGVLDAANPQFFAPALPFVFKDYADVYDHVDAPKGQEWLKKNFDEMGLVYLATFSNGISQITNNKREVFVPDDLKGLKMRVYGETDFKLMSALGADAINMSWSEVYSAMQQGAIDGHINGLQTISSANIQEVQKYITMVNMTWSGYHVCIGNKDWGKFSEPLQQVLKEKAVEAAIYGRQLLDQQESELRTKFEQNGNVFCDVTDEQLQQWKALTHPVSKDIIAKLSEETCEVWDLK